MDIDFDIFRENGFYKRIQESRLKDMQRVTENGGWKDIHICPVCGYSQNTELKYSFEHIKSVICPLCGTLYNNKIPKVQNSGEYLIEDIENYKQSADEKKKEYRKKRFATERIGIIQNLMDKPLSELNLLDVGCNTGFFLEVAKEHFKEVRGIDNSEKIRAYAEKVTGVDVHITFDETLPKFDVITLFDVIEHVEKPFKLIHKCWEYLNPGGLLLIYTPNYESFSFEVLKTNNTQYFPSDHLFIINKKTAIYIASKIGAIIPLLETKGTDMFDILAFERDINNIDVSGMLIKKNINKVQKIINDSGKANHLRFALRKWKKCPDMK